MEHDSGRVRAIVTSYVGVLVFAAPLFVAAGGWFWQGGLYLALAVAGTTLTHALAPAGSNLAAERARGAGAGEVWDRRLLGASFLANVATFVVAGLDHRDGATDLPLWAAGAGGALMLAGQTLFALARRENTFFTSTVRIVTEREHRVCDTGPYRFVRHPGYLGLLLAQLAFPLVTGSGWAFAPALVGGALLIARTALEDRFLTARLAGYVAYTHRTRWRLVPGVF